MKPAGSKYFGKENGVEDSMCSHFKRFYAMVLCIGLGFTGCSKKTDTAMPDQSDGSENALTKVRLQLDWYAQPEYGGFFQAYTKGFYKDVGLDVEILNAAPGFPFFQSVAQGRSEFGTVRFDMLAQSVQEGLPIKAIAYYMSHSPVAIMVHEDSPIQSFEDLDGKTLMANPVVPFLDWLKQTYDLDLAVVPSKWEVGTFMAKKVDSQQCFITSEPYYLAQQGFKVRTMLISETGFDPYRIVYVNNSFAQKNPEVVKKFVAASIQGWLSFFTEESQATHAMIQERNEKISSGFFEWSKKTMIESGVVFGKEAPPYPHFGKLDPVRLEAMIRVLQQLGLIEEGFDVNAAYSNDYVPQS